MLHTLWGFQNLSIGNSRSCWLREIFSHCSFSFFMVFLFWPQVMSPGTCTDQNPASYSGDDPKMSYPFAALSYLALCSVNSCCHGFPGIIVKSLQLKKSAVLHLGLSSLDLDLESFSKQWLVESEGVSHWFPISWNAVLLWLIVNVLSAVASMLSTCFCCFSWQNKSHSILLKIDENKIFSLVFGCMMTL